MGENFVAWFLPARCESKYQIFMLWWVRYFSVSTDDRLCFLNHHSDMLQGYEAKSITLDAETERSKTGRKPDSP